MQPILQMDRTEVNMTDCKRPTLQGFPGVYATQEGISASFCSGQADCGILLYDKQTGKRLGKVPFPPENRIGDVHFIEINGVDSTQISYMFYEGERILPDPMARAFVGRKSYGSKQEESTLRAAIPSDDFEWEDDALPRIPYDEMVAYLLHVRGFTRHKSSGVSHGGTFAGMTEKLPYLKALGVTTVEVQPIYEFLEHRITEPQGKNDPDITMEYLDYWGYQKGFYYAPKAAYSAGSDPGAEWRETIKAFHLQHMEVVMQFYFPEDVPLPYIPDILRFWVTQYHIDGFRLIGSRIAPEWLLQDPILADTKIWCGEVSLPLFNRTNLSTANQVNRSASGGDDKKRFALYRNDFRYDMCRFLKGDEGSLERALHHMRENPQEYGRINFLTNYDGFTLMDMVSYERKHNEANGEENQDGRDGNETWNCGVEGPSRKRSVMELRKRQIKNALGLLFFSQAAPLLFMGDEFGNSQKGNNNPYCQDNDITWLNWSNLERYEDIYRFTLSLIYLRKHHPIFRQPAEMRIMDYLSCGYPDLSYHGVAPWKPNVNKNSHFVGVMYCGKYADDNSFYLAINMHWEDHTFLLPKLPKELHWEQILATAGEFSRIPSEEGAKVPSRSIAVFMSAP
jgi:glycogen operon protein